MPKRILIVDDDDDFNKLLTDVYSQGDYEVTASNDAFKGLEAFKANPFDLVVTDQRMPGMTGNQFVNEILACSPETPVIMVSGYLENDTIRDLIRQGVSGVFLKPLNIFSLLKRTSELLARKKDGAGGPGETESGAAGQSLLPFRFTAFAGKAPKAAAFAKKLHDLRDFKSKLLLTGEPGSPFEEICADLCAFNGETNDDLVFLSADDFSHERVFQGVKQAEANQAGRVTIAFMDVDKMDAESSATIFAAAKKEGDFTAVSIPVRFVFCLTEELDALYEQGRIDGELYIFIGATEIRVPPLREYAEDIPLIARHILEQAARKEDVSPPELDWGAKSYLQKLAFPRNYQELKRTVLAAMKMAKDRPITKADLAYAYEYKDARAPGQQAEGLEQYLRVCRDDYLNAVLELCGGKIEDASATLKTPVNFLKTWQQAAAGNASA